MKMLSLQACAISAALAAAVAAGGAWQVQAWRYESKELARLEAEKKKTEENREQTEKAANGLEEDKTKIEIRYKTITKTVTKLVDRPVYSNVCLDQDGINAVNGVSR